MSMQNNRLIRCFALFALFCLGFGPVSAWADIRGLTIGIDDYFRLGPAAHLEGAVNDAEDLGSTLKSTGAKEVVVLRNKEAGRDRVMETWQRLVRQSRVGDVLVLAFAGHGTQEPERIKGSEADGLDEVFLLAGYAAQAPYNQERLRDDDLAGMLDMAARSGVRVIFVADACHSGTMTRGVDTRVRPFKVRALPKQTLVEDQLPPPSPEEARMEIQGIDGVLAFGAVQDHELAPETLIEGHPRGALSWAMGKALRGEADLNHDGQVTDAELTDYVREIIRTRMEGQQHPTLPTTRGLPLVVLGVAGATLKLVSAAGSAWDLCKRYNLFNFCMSEGEEEQAKTAPVASPAPSPSPLGINIRSTAPAPEEVAAKLQRVRLVSDGSATLTWDLARGEMLNALGDVVAYLNERAQRNTPSPTRAFARVRTDEPQSTSAPTPSGSLEDLPRAQRVIDKWRLIEGLKQAAERRPLRMSLTPDDGVYNQGKEVTINVGGLESPYLTLFNLASDGSLNFLYPLSGPGFADPLTVPLDRPHSLRLRVEPPFGADHFVALASSQPLTKLHAALARLEKTQSLTELESVLRAEFVPQPIQLGVHGVYTRP